MCQNHHHASLSQSYLVQICDYEPTNVAVDMCEIGVFGKRLVCRIQLFWVDRTDIQYLGSPPYREHTTGV